MHRRIIAALCFALTLAACGGAPAAVTPAQVSQSLTAVGATNIHDEVIEADSPVPHSFTAHQAFEIPSVAPKGGHYFICDSKKNCDAIFAYYDALKALAGPYTYQSPSGTVVAQLNSGLTPDEAAKFEAAIKALP